MGWVVTRGVASTIVICGISVFAARPVVLMPEDRVDKIRKILPPVADATLNDLLNSGETIWYDRESIVPGYQDSYGDNAALPMGMRPNTIAPPSIDVGVPGGHAQLFFSVGVFHFPFGRTGGLNSAKNTHVVDFWQLPSIGGKRLPVAWWNYRPSSLTHRIQWVFPIGTVFGEVLLLHDGSDWSVFEFRTRTRHLTGWEVDVFRPFRSAVEFAEGLQLKRKQKLSWIADSDIDNLIRHLHKSDPMTQGKLSAPHFVSAFSEVKGAVDTLPAVADTTILKELLKTTAFASVKGTVWREDGVKRSYAPSTQADFHIVPKNYEGAFFEVSETFCNRCHSDAGRPLRDFYPSVEAYGELWGEDDVFSWHPFETDNFVDTKTGQVRNFNYDNRKMRRDFVNAGLVEKYESKKHPARFYMQIDHKWKNYKY